MADTYTTRALATLDAAYTSGELPNIDNFIDNEFVPPVDGAYLDSINPATAQAWAHIADSDAVIVNRAVAAARTAFHGWSRTSVQARSQMLHRIADVVERHAEAFARYESIDQGKPLSLARTVDIPRCVYNFRFFATSILHATNESIVQHEPVHAVNYVVRDPLGVAGLISPWNLPLYLLSFKIAPALASGNTVVAKPSEFTSVTAWLLAHAMLDAGLPRGVVNLVLGTGPRAGEPLVTHPDVPLISFTGSTVVGRRIQALTAPLTKKLSLEMGGKNACIVFDDANLDEAVPTVVRSCFANQGEICLCTSRLLVQRPIFDAFVARLVEQTRALVVGAPFDANTNLGALVSAQHYDKVKRYMQMAADDAHITVHCGGVGDSLDRVPPNMKQGYFLPPTVVTGMDVSTSPLMREEIFGPIVCVAPFDDDAEAVALANDCEYGLSASLWSRDVCRVHCTAQKLQAGTVWCNCWLVRELNMPFGGMKASGVGREGAHDSLDFFTEKKTICIRL